MTDSKPMEFTIRKAQKGDLKYLNEIELAAAGTFPAGSIPETIRNEALPVELLVKAQSEGRLFVAADSSDKPAGFIVVVKYNDKAFIIELDVHPCHHRKGLGKALISAAVDWAKSHKCNALTLTTFSSIPWNAPYYERLGFKRLKYDELDNALAAQLINEGKRGLEDRVAMSLRL